MVGAGVISRFPAGLLVLVLLLAGWVPARAGGLTLGQVVSRVLAYAPELKAAQERLERARLARKEAFTCFLPTLSTRYAYQRLQDPARISTPLGDVVTAWEHTWSWSTTLHQPLFTGFRLASAYRLAELGVDLAGVELAGRRLDLELAAVEAYLEYLRAQKARQVARQAVRRLQAHLKVARDFHQAGVVALNAVLKTKVELARAQQELVRAANAVEMARARLNRLMGRSLEAPLAVVDILKVHTCRLDYARAREQARRHRPELKAMALRIRQAEQAVRRARSAYWPQVGLAASYQFTADSPELGDSAYYDATGWQVSASLDWSLWEWGRTRHRVGQARAELRRLKALARQLGDEVDLQVKRALLFLHQSSQNIATARTAVDQARENYRLTRDRYEQQLTTNTELLDAQTLLTRARNDYYTALTVYNLALARLMRAVGRHITPALAGAAKKKRNPQP